MKHATLKTASSRTLNAEQIEQFGQELDAIRSRIMGTLGEHDVRYIRHLMTLQKRSEIGGRIALMFGLNPLAFLAGTGMLAFSKILENMEIGHNIMHGQYAWTGDPDLQGNRYEWDTVCPGDQWRHSHNYMHHTFTNIIGKDRDVGYGIMRLSEKQAWHPAHLLQPVYNLVLALGFEWGVALHDLEMDRVRRGEKTLAQVREEFKPIGKKIGKQVLKDYILFPALAGPFFLPVLAGNFIANLIRNIWAYAIIFCGHFTDNVDMYTPEECENESRGQWYLRQLHGSSNLTGGKWFHILSGNLSHQIEHHLFPDMPANRYANVAVEVQAICQRYGQHYNTGSFSTQLGQVMKRIFTHMFPTRPASGTTPPPVQQKETIVVMSLQSAA